jgi:hypothetical protein
MHLASQAIKRMDSKTGKIAFHSYVNSENKMEDDLLIRKN